MLLLVVPPILLLVILLILAYFLLKKCFIETTENAPLMTVKPDLAAELEFAKALAPKPPPWRNGDAIR